MVILEEQQAYGEERVRLQVFMTTSTTYKAEKILSRLPYDGMSSDWIECLC